MFFFLSYLYLSPFLFRSLPLLPPCDLLSVFPTELKVAAEVLGLPPSLGDVLQQPWPEWSLALVQEDMVEVVLQVGERGDGGRVGGK